MISVVIPTYKSPDALDLCLRSAIRGQSEKNEIIVVIDGFLDLNKSIISKYINDIRVINIPENVGTCRSTNLGAYYASNNKLLIVNDDNVFPENWDLILNNDYRENSVISINQIEPFPSIFKQIHIKDFGRDPIKFDLDLFWSYSKSISTNKIEETGSTFPIFLSKIDLLRLGGFDENYPSQSGAVSDWDFFLKCTISKINTIRSYSCHFYHFVSLSSKSLEQMPKSAEDERNCHEYAKFKWGRYIQHDPISNKKYI